MADGTLEDTISETLKEIQSRGAETGLETEPAKAVSEDSEALVAGEQAAEPDASGKARDEKGRFAKPEPAKAAQAGPATENVAPEPQSATQEPAQAAIAAPEGIDLNRPPASWKAGAKAKWDKLDADLRAEIYRREGDYHRGTADLRQTADFGSRVQSVVEPYRMLIQAEGGTPERAIAQLLQTAALFRVGTPAQKQAALIQIAQQYGIQMPQFVAQDAQQPQGGQAAPFADPRVDALMQQLQQQEFQRQQAAQAEQQRQLQDYEKASALWLNAAGADGKLLHPFIDNVMEYMLPKVQQIKAGNPSLSHDQILQQAYERACWEHPEVRAVLLQQQQQDLEAKRRQEILARTDAAKRASAGNLPKRGALQPQKPTGSMEDTIRETYRSLQNG
jgi:hypothetical protein